MATTGTMKMQKGTLKKEGVDLELVSEPMYWLPPGGQGYVKYGKEDFESLKSGKVKL